MDTDYFWMIEAIAGVLALLGLQYAIKKIIARAAGKEEQGWRRRLGKVFQPPISLLIWTLLVLYLIDVFGKHFGFSIALTYLGALRKTAVVACFAWLFLRWKNEIEHFLVTDPSKKVDLTTVQMIGRLATVALGIITGLIIMQVFGVNITPLLTFGTIGAASLGFAGKDVIANFCSGIMLQIGRPFVRGDLISLPEKNLEGHIEDIGWFRTSIRDLEKRAVYLPNNFFSTMVVVNVTRLTHRHLKQMLKIPLDHIEKITTLVPKIHDTVARHPGIDARFPVHVYLKAFGEYACELEIDAYSTIVDAEAFNRFQQEILLKILAVLSAMDISLAIPTMSWKQIS